MSGIWELRGAAGLTSAGGCLDAYMSLCATYVHLPRALKVGLRVAESSLWGSGLPASCSAFSLLCHAFSLLLACGPRVSD